MAVTGGTCGAPNWGLNEWPWIVRTGMTPGDMTKGDLANAETLTGNAEAFLANAEAFATTLTCSPGQRGNPASCALSMILNLDWTDTLARRRGFFRALVAGRAGPPMSPDVLRGRRPFR